MRNLKKVLSLSLALVMLLGMMVVGAGAAAYTDTVDSEKEEAIEVMSAVKIITGDGTGSFNPDSTLDRAQAAVIIARVLLTPDVVTKLGAVDCQFTDVTPYPWAMAPIQACANAGVIKGYDETTFGPTDKVTGVQFAVMLLRLLGFDDSAYTGATWELAARQDAIKAGLDANGVSITSTPMTREDAAQMAMNALVYSPSGEKVYTCNGQTFDSFIEAYLYSNNNTYPITVSTAKDSLATTRFNLVSDTKLDGFGREVNIWKVGKDEVYATSTAATAPVVTYTRGGVTADQVKKDTGASTSSVDGTKVYTNGSAGSAGSVAIESLAANGKTVEVYAANKVVTKVVVIAPTVATLSADPVTRTQGETEQVRVPGALGSWTAADKVSGWEGLVKGDVVLYVKDKDNNYTIEKADAITGTVTSYSSTKGVEVDGTYYPQTGLGGTPLTSWNSEANKFKTEWTFYLDATGSVVKYVQAGEDASTESSYAIVRDVAWFAGSGFDAEGHMEAKLLKTDGTYETVTVASVDGFVPVTGGTQISDLDGSITHVTANIDDLDTASAKANCGDTAVGTTTVADKKFAVGGTSSEGEITKKYYGASKSSDLTDGTSKFIVKDQFYSYTVNSDGAYVLTNVASADALEDAAIVKGAAKFNGASGATANANTVFLFDTGAGKTPEIYTGIANIPSAAAPSNHTTGNTVVLKDGIAQFVFIKGAVVSNESSDVVYIADVTYSETPNGRLVNAFINGEEGTITLASDVTPTAGLYTVTSVNDKGVSTLSSQITMGTGIQTNAGGVLQTLAVAATGSKQLFTTDEETVVYVIEGAGDKATCNQVGATDIEADSTDDIWVFLAPNTTTDLAGTIYVVKKDITRPTLTAAAGDSNAVTTAPTFAADGTASVEVEANKNTIKLTNPTVANHTVKVALSGDAASAVADYTSEDAIALTVPEAETTKTLTITVTVTDNNNSNIVETFTYTLTVQPKAAAAGG